MIRSVSRNARILLPLIGAAALVACGQKEETTYEVDATDESGGELIVSDVDPDAVPVEEPMTEMTSVPAGEEGDGGDAGE